MKKLIFEVEVTINNKEDWAAFIDRGKEKIRHALEASGMTVSVRSHHRHFFGSFDDLDYALEVDAAHGGN